MFIRCVLLYLSGRQLDVSCGGCFKCMLLWYSVWMVWAVSLCLNSLFLSVSAQVPLSLISLEPLDQLSAPLADLNPVCDCQELVYDIMWLVQWGSSDMSSCSLEDSFLLRNSFSSCISSCESAVGGVSCSCSFSASVSLSGVRADVVISYQDWSLLDLSVALVHPVGLLWVVSGVLGFAADMGYHSLCESSSIVMLSAFQCQLLVLGSEVKDCRCFVTLSRGLFVVGLVG